MIPFCVSAQGAGICRHCCEPRECCTPENCALGKESQKLYDEIQELVKNAGQIENWLAFGNALTCAETVGVGCDLDQAAKAMGAMGPIVRGEINNKVTFFLTNQTTYKALTSAERKYWEDVQKNTLPIVPPAK
jgi:hypothetical protein